ncbi:MAG: diphosphomevalonate decarboxylase [Microgenomates group bacterium]
MKITAVAPANIAFIKYWGKRSGKFRLPLNDSISMNLSGAVTMTTVEFSSAFTRDDISFVGESISESESKRIKNHLDRLRRLARKKIYAHVVTKNSFPKGTGIASSASGFAALSFAASRAIGLALSEKELTILARIGSGSAARSIPDGFVWWHAGKKSADSYAESLFPSTWWNMCDMVCVVSKETKKISSTEGMDAIKTSPNWRTRVQQIPEKIIAMQEALTTKNIHAFGALIEEDAISMHCVMMTQKPPLFYWNDATLRVMDAVYELRKNGTPAYYTMDAGPNVHILCEEKNEEIVHSALKNVFGVQSVIVNAPARGTHCIQQHLF